jgi:hypothetical protein
VARTTQQAKVLAKQNKCKDLRKLAEQAGKIWVEAGEAALAEPCQDPVAAAPARPDAGVKPTPRPEPAPKPTPRPEPDKPEPAPVSEANLEELVTEAEAAARNGQYGRGLKLCEDALRQDKSNVRAMTTCAISACNLKLAAKAKNYINRLQGQGSRHAAMRQICLRLQVPID